jgi:ankyrin repeat protein
MSRLWLLGMVFSTMACAPGAILPLGAAARRGDLELMRELLQAGADPNDAGGGSLQWPPLLHAVHTHQLDAARLLLDYGANPDGVGPNGYAALMMAAGAQDPGLVTLLIDYGADVYRVGPSGITALSEAVTGGPAELDRPIIAGCHPDTVRVLLSRAPDLRLPNGNVGHEAQFWMRLHAGLQKARNLAMVPTAGTAPCDR